MGKYSILAAVACVLVHCSLVAWIAWWDTPSPDEMGHLAAGLSHWRFGRFDLYRVNPPLVRMWGTLPVLTLEPRENWSGFHSQPASRCEFEIGRTLLKENGLKYFRMLSVARWACLPFSVLGAVVCWRWSHHLYGPAAGFVAVILWASCPNMIAHAARITPDVAASALAALAGYTFWRWLREGSWQMASVAGLALGFAELAKMTLVIFFVVWPALWLFWRWTSDAARSEKSSGSRRCWLQEFGQLSWCMGLALVVVNAAYGWEGSFMRLREYEFVSDRFQELFGPSFSTDSTPVAAQSWWTGVPVPLPKNYVSGIDVQCRDFEGMYKSYLRGQWQLHGWWYYYLYAFALKVPLGTQALLALAAVMTARRWPEHLWRDEIVLLAPAVAVLVLVSSETGFSHHLRYVLPMFPFLFVWASKVGTLFSARDSDAQQAISTHGCAVGARIWLRQRAGAVAVGLLLIWSCVSSLSVFPHSVSYFNCLAGGPNGGHNHLLHSNMDWGQDLWYLRRWLDQHPEATDLGLLSYSWFDPRALAIRYRVPPQGPPGPVKYKVDLPNAVGPKPGWYAVSVSFLHGCEFLVPDGTGGPGEHVDQPYYTYFLKFKPVAMAGYSIYIYHITIQEANRVRREMGLPEIAEKVPSSPKIADLKN